MISFISFFIHIPAQRNVDQKIIGLCAPLYLRAIFTILWFLLFLCTSPLDARSQIRWRFLRLKDVPLSFSLPSPCFIAVHQRRAGRVWTHTVECRFPVQFAFMTVSRLGWVARVQDDDELALFWYQVLSVYNHTNHSWIIPHPVTIHTFAKPDPSTLVGVHPSPSWFSFQDYLPVLL